MSKAIQERKQLVEKQCDLSIVKQCKLLDIHRSYAYYRPAAESFLNLELMRIIDQEYMLHPWLGVPRMTAWLNKDKGYQVNHKRISRLYKLMDIEAMVPRPNKLQAGEGEGTSGISLFIEGSYSR